MQTFEIHDRDKQGEILDKCMDTRHGNATFQDYLVDRDDSVVDHILEYYQDYDETETLIDYTYDGKTGLHYQEYWTESGDPRYGAFDNDGIWYESEDIVLGSKFSQPSSDTTSTSRNSES